MGRQWTRAQKEAIETRGGHILVSAGAGSGKTAVLVERVISRLFDQEPADIDELLIVTFTRAAAEEMRSRIGRALLEKAQDTFLPEAERAAALAQYARMSQASIMTLHSFCLETVREKALSVGLKRNFRVAAAGELRQIERRVMDDCLERAYLDEGSAVESLSSALGGLSGDSGIAEIVYALYSFARSQIKPEQWLMDAAGEGSGEGSREGSGDPWWRISLSKEAGRRFSLAEEYLKAALDNCPEEMTPQRNHLSGELERVRAAVESGFSPALTRAAADFSVMPAMRRVSEDIRESVREPRDAAKKIIREACVSLSAYVWTEERGDSSLTRALAALTTDFMRSMREERRRRGVVDFADMEHYCLAILEKEAGEDGPESGEGSGGDALGRDLPRTRYKEVLVDEYQDINTVQERIINLAAGGGDTFLVGDVKQGIYRFRLADVALFMRKYADFTLGLGGRRILLARNFRSSIEVIEAVNEVFSAIMTSETCGIDYNEVRLIPGAKRRGPPAELIITDTAMAGEEDLSTARGEARIIGARILELADEGYKASDMAVLLRSPKDWGEAIASEFAAMGIAAAFVSGTSFFESSEVALIIALLKIIDNPLQDIEFAAVLRSPLFGYSADDLLNLCYGEPIYESVQKAAAEHDAKARLFMQKYRLFREISLSERVSDLVLRIYGETCFIEMASAMEGGGQKARNLRRFYEKTREFEETAGGGLFRFLLYLEEGAKADGRSPSAATGGAVPIMSVHNAKGLEFPVVFIGGLGRSFNLKDTRRDVLWHPKYGLQVKTADIKNRRKYPTSAWRALSAELIWESVAEEMRIFYVAMTRARDRLIMTGSGKNLPSLFRKWLTTTPLTASLDYAEKEASLPAGIVCEERSYLGWMGRALIHTPAGYPLRSAARDGKEYNKEEIKEEIKEGVLSPATPVWRVAVTGAPPLKADISLNTVEADSPAEKDEVYRVLSYKYPRLALSALPAKWSVTGLADYARKRPSSPPALLQDGAADIYDIPEEADEDIRPSAMPLSGEESAAARLGTAYHLLLERLDFAALDFTPRGFKSGGAAAETLSALVKSGEIAPDTAELIDLSMVENFLISPLGGRIIAAAKRGEVLKEKVFTYKIAADRIDPALDEGEYVLVQGMIDLVFFENGGWVIVDYKSGSAGASENDIRERYAPQTELYQEAWEAITRAGVSETYIYLLTAGKSVKISPR